MFSSKLLATLAPRNLVHPIVGEKQIIAEATRTSPSTVFSRVAEAAAPDAGVMEWRKCSCAMLPKYGNARTSRVPGLSSERRRSPVNHQNFSPGDSTAFLAPADPIEPLGATSSRSCCQRRASSIRNYWSRLARRRDGTRRRNVGIRRPSFSTSRTSIGIVVCNRLR